MSEQVSKSTAARLQRREEVNLTGADHETYQIPIPVYDVYEDERGRIEVFAPPLPSGTAPVTVYADRKRFYGGGTVVLPSSDLAIRGSVSTAPHPAYLSVKI